MKCSVALCTYNGEEFLPQQLASIIEQTRLPDEVVISDDASTDATPEIVSRFMSDARSLGVDVRFFRQTTTQGVTANFEFVTRLTQNEIIFLADQDDVWNSGKVERILREFEDPSVVLVASDAQLIDGNDELLKGILSERLLVRPFEREQLMRGDLSILAPSRNLFTGATMALRRNVLLTAMPFTSHLHHDDWLAQIAWLVGDIRMLSGCLMSYRLHARNTIGIQAVPLQTVMSESNPRRAHLLWQISRLDPVVALITQKGSGSFKRQERVRLRLRQHHFLTERSDLPRCLTLRVKRIAAMWRQGLYQDFPQGWRSAFADLVRPAGANV